MSDYSKILSRVDLRQITIDELNGILKLANEEHGATFKFLFLTNFGFIQGEIVDDLDGNVSQEELTDFGIAINKTVEFRRETIMEAEKLNDSLRPINDAGFFHLKNVIIKPYAGGSRHQINEMIIFTDQITGLTFSDSFDL